MKKIQIFKTKLIIVIYCIIVFIVFLDDINNDLIYYYLNEDERSATEDSFEFDIIGHSMYMIKIFIHILI